MAPNRNNRRVNKPQDNQRQISKHAQNNRRRAQPTKAPRDNTRYYGCGICQADHRIMTCNKFLNLNLAQKYQKVLQLHYCTNCLARNHVLKNCTNQARCGTCDQKHHTLLHGHKMVLNNIRTENKKPLAKPAKKVKPSTTPS